MDVGKYHRRSSPLGSRAPPDLMSNYIGKIGHISFCLNRIKDLSVKFELLKFLNSNVVYVTPRSQYACLPVPDDHERAVAHYMSLPGLQ